MRFPVLISAACLILGLLGCGGGGSTTETGSTETETTTQRRPALSEPKVHIPHGPPPKKLVIKDLKTGSGPEARQGDVLTIQYVGFGYGTRKKFGGSWERGRPSYLELGHAMPGWEKGIPGMRAGGRRELIIPPRLTYAELGEDETLVYVIDLLAIE